MKVAFVRHGESHANTLRIISNRGLRYGLTMRGREQAVSLASRLCRMEPSVSMIYSSPLLRAIETSIVVAHELQIDYQVTSALGEIDCGELEGCSGDDSWQRWHELYDAWLSSGRLGEAYPGGESVLQARDRLQAFIGDLAAEAGHLETTVVCVGHGALYRLSLPLILREPSNDDPSQMSELANTEAIVAELGPVGLVRLADQRPPHESS